MALELVVVPGNAGEHRFRLAGGRERDGAEPLFGAGHLLDFAATARGVLSGVDLADGKLAWQQDLGDALQAPPVVAGDHLLVAYGGRSLARLQVSDGAATHTVTHPTLIRDVIAIPSTPKRLAVVDTAGTVTVYRGDSLAVEGVVRLAIRPSGVPLYIADAPHQWSQAGMLVDRGPLLLVPGDDGICYLPKMPE
jgi:hypothetical protein